MRLLVPVLMCVAAVLVGSSQLLAEPIQWKLADGGNGNFYEVISVPGGISWDNANAAAVAAGKYLATITSQQENDFVFGLVDAPQYWYTRPGFSNYGPWLGGFQFPPTTVPAANWNWVTGEPWGYTHWNAGEPNDFQGLQQDKLMYLTSSSSLRASTWNDEVTGGGGGHPPIAYVVESPEPSTFALLGVGIASLLLYAWRRRKR